MTTILVKKRSGKLEPIDLGKIHRVLEWASEGLDVSVSQVELKAHLQFYDGIATEEIHETMIKSAADLISEETPDYQYLAAILSMYHIRKKVFGNFEPPTLMEQIKRVVDLGFYDKALLTMYTEDEYNEMDSWIVHDRDMQYAYAAVKQFEGKYLVQDRVKHQLHETPQFLYMLVSACLHHKYDKDKRMGYIKQFYDACTTNRISLPTPIMAGVRTPTKQYSSCVVIETGDSLDSINASASAVVKYVSQRAGIGLNVGAIRGLGSPIRGGEAFHTGCIPFYKHFQTAVKSCSQGGVRGGAATLYYPLWHSEFESLIVLKNNRGVEENRVRGLDYTVQINGFLYKRLVNGGNITLFSPSDVPGLYEAFFEDQERFAELYEQYEQDPMIARKKTIPAIQAFTQIAIERAGTGRIYIQNVDHCNTHTPFDPAVAPIRQSNLCLEIALPTKPLNDIKDPEGEISLCTLAAFNLGKINDLSELDDLAMCLIRALDALLDFQNYPILAAELSTMKRRTLGVGTIGFAHYLAKNGVRYSDGSANELTHQTFEHMQYALMKASMMLAKELGACPGFVDTVRAKGVMPIDSYKKSVDDLVEPKYLCDWEQLRADIQKYGMRNSTVSALMPSETSSQIANETNGIEPPRGYMSIKASKDGILRQIVPELDKYRYNYELLWRIPNNQGYLNLVAIMQKFVDQSISANTNYDPARFDGGKVPVKEILQDILHAYKNGVKTLYYHNTRDGQDDSQNDIIEEEDDGCSNGACKI